MTDQPDRERARLIAMAGLADHTELQGDDCRCARCVAFRALLEAEAEVERLSKENERLRLLLRETRMYALGSDCSTQNLINRVDEFLATPQPGAPTP